MMKMKGSSNIYGAVGYFQYIRRMGIIKVSSWVDRTINFSKEAWEVQRGLEDD